VSTFLLNMRWNQILLQVAAILLLVYYSSFKLPVINHCVCEIKSLKQTNIKIQRQNES
jgi:hypothetical protein